MLWFQNNISKIIFIAAGVLLQAFNSHAQLIVVQDPAFRNALCTFSPSSMNANCHKLDTVKALIASGNIVLNGMGISNADEIIYFKNADTIRLANNNLTSFPINITRFRHLNRLSLANNQLVNAPDIHYTNALSGDTAIKFVYLLNNKISYLPPSWNAYNSMTQVIDLRNNELKKIPTFINYPEIRRLDLRDNHLTFEYLVPIMQNPRWSTSNISLFPQKNFPVELDTFVKIGDVLHVTISTGLASNEYTLLLDNTVKETNRTGDFYIAINTAADTGKYSFKIRNDNFPGTSDFLSSEIKNIHLQPINEKHKEVIIFSPNGDGNGDVVFVDGIGSAKIVNKNGVEIQSISLPYIWDGTDKNGKILTPGLYYIQKSDGSVLKALLIN
ncbi:hypothetical protein [Cytophaga aurantiaca]|uniref:hypothetical protein n=1 Tax=Cytophaga aurantiaca TaxID=29530 RepID=UPI00037DCE82|nr:hypothetical protein [Cytophaga aurantiaca]